MLHQKRGKKGIKNVILLSKFILRKIYIFLHFYKKKLICWWSNRILPSTVLCRPQDDKLVVWLHFSWQVVLGWLPKTFPVLKISDSHFHGNGFFIAMVGAYGYRAHWSDIDTFKVEEQPSYWEKFPPRVLEAGNIWRNKIIGTKEEGFFVADRRTGTEVTLRGPRGPKKCETNCN